MTNRPLMVDWVETALKGADEAKATRMGLVIKWRARVALALVVFCILAGIWLDWRWFATATLPLASLIVDGMKIQALLWVAKNGAEPKSQFRAKVIGTQTTEADPLLKPGWSIIGPVEVPPGTEVKVVQEL